MFSWYSGKRKGEGAGLFEHQRADKKQRHNDRRRDGKNSKHKRSRWEEEEKEEKKEESESLGRRGWWWWQSKSKKVKQSSSSSSSSYPRETVIFVEPDDAARQEVRAAYMERWREGLLKSHHAGRWVLLDIDGVVHGAGPSVLAALYNALASWQQKLSRPSSYGSFCCSLPSSSSSSSSSSLSPCFQQQQQNKEKSSSVAPELPPASCALVCVGEEHKVHSARFRFVLRTSSTGSNLDLEIL